MHKQQKEKKSTAIKSKKSRNSLREVRARVVVNLKLEPSQCAPPLVPPRECEEADSLLVRCQRHDRTPKKPAALLPSPFVVFVICDRESIIK